MLGGVTSSYNSKNECLEGVIKIHVASDIFHGGIVILARVSQNTRSGATQVLSTKSMIRSTFLTSQHHRYSDQHCY